MASIVIRNLEPSTKEALRRRAAANGRSMEAEARVILSREMNAPPAAFGLGTAMRQRFLELGDPGVEVPERREDAARSTDFSQH
ncbi:FitA-like ribbon-helix-helix domain-containing protein [Zhihengliuella salsuginis]|nr:plasmid stabilization protein [Zhihengliuella salsuginis]